MRIVFYHIVLWLTALSLLNRSIDVEDVPEPYNSSSADIIEYNEIETISEYLLEQATDESLPDNKESDQKSIAKKTVTQDFSIGERRDKPVPAPFLLLSIADILRNQRQKLPKGFITILTPPPDLIA